MPHTIEQIVVAAQELLPEEVRRLAPRVATDEAHPAAKWALTKNYFDM